MPRQPTQDLAALVALVRDLTERNTQLAGQVGFWQARAQGAEERVKQLEAPVAPEPAPEPEAPRPWWTWFPWWRTSC
jgi:hypothetical protein